MRWLVDNNVPRSVTLLLRDSGHDAVEVRQVLALDALDQEVAAYARAAGRIVLTHDRGLARRCLALGLVHLWMRTREPDDVGRRRASLTGIEAHLSHGTALRAVLSARRLTFVAPTPPQDASRANCALRSYGGRRASRLAESAPSATQTFPDWSIAGHQGPPSRVGSSIVATTPLDGS